MATVVTMNNKLNRMLRDVKCLTFAEGSAFVRVLAIILSVGQ
jgi:hypothetical protein